MNKTILLFLLFVSLFGYIKLKKMHISMIIKNHLSIIGVNIYEKLFFYILPFLWSAYLVFGMNLILEEKLINILITTFSILIGFIINALLVIIGFNLDEKYKNYSKEHKDIYVSRIRELFGNLIFLLLISLILIFLLLVQVSITNNKKNLLFFLNGINVSIFYLIIMFFLLLPISIKRIYIIGNPNS